MNSDKKWDVFISHAHEDKERIARPLALALTRHGLNIWYDEFALGIGDSLQKCINRGLAESKFGIVILSHNFFKKQWTDTELSALYSKQHSTKQKVILPIWHEIEYNEILNYAPTLSDLVALSTEMPLSLLVNKILDEVQKVSKIDISKYAPTGIAKLDKILGAGLRRNSSIVIEGPKGIGKTTLAIQIQLASLDRGEPCLYITYRELPNDIIDFMLRLGAPLEDYVAAGKFKILDNFSAISGISKNEVLSQIPQSLHSAIIRVDNPENRETYYKLQLEIMEDLGTGGVNVIDSTNERYQMMKGESKYDESAEKFFRRFKARIGRIGNHIGIHLVTDLKDNSNLLKLLGNLQDGVIRMHYEDNQIGRLRFLQVENISQFNTNKHEFIITPDGIKIIS